MSIKGKRRKMGRKRRLIKIGKGEIEVGDKD
jgi:hypothetical protein